MKVEKHQKAKREEYEMFHGFYFAEFQSKAFVNFLLLVPVNSKSKI